MTHRLALEHGMKRIVALLPALLLSGCVTYSEMQQRPAQHEADSSKSPQAYVDCALPGFVDLQADTHAMKDGTAMVIVGPISTRGGDIGMTVTATPRENGSHVALRAIAKTSTKRAWAVAARCL
jgi:hypothetical protein